jgi:AcrR family transcriptional regulator
MARTKSVSDEALLDAALGLMARAGPAALTFAALGEATRLAPATLVQRFASKDRLLQAALLHAWDLLEVSTAKADQRLPVTPEGAVRLAMLLSAADGGQVGEGMLLLVEDFRDPVLRARGVFWGDALAAAFGRRLTPDRASQERLGRLMAAQWQGALIWWGFSRAGSIRGYVRRELTEWCRVVASGEKGTA